MVNSTSQNALREIFNRSLADPLNSNFVNGEWELSEDNDIKNVQISEFYMLTISAVCSHFIILLHFANNTDNKNIVSEKIKKNELELTDNEFYDYIAELSNIVSGRVKHELGISLPYSGMSVPRLMSIDSIRYVNELSFNWDVHLTAKFGNIQIGASLLVNANDDVKILPPIEKTEDEMGFGVMEMF